MDNKRLILVMLVATLLMAMWALGLPWVAQQLGYDLFPPPVEQAATNQSVDAVQAPPGSTTVPTQPAGALRVLTQATPESITLGSATPEHDRFAMQLTLSSVGAGVNEVVLNDFRREANAPERYSFEHPYGLQPDAWRPLATHSLTIAGQTLELSSVPWAVDPERTNQEQVAFFVDVGTAKGPLVRVSKLIRLYPRTSGDDDARGGFELLVRQEIQNLTDVPLAVSTQINGPTSPPRELETGYDRMIIAGFRGRNQTVSYEAFDVEAAFTDENAQRELVSEGEGAPLLWAGASTIYFNAIARPMGQSETAGGEAQQAQFLDKVVATALNPEEEDRHERQVGLRFHTRELVIPAGGAEELPFRVFFGPKKRDLLKNAYYARPEMHYDETLVSPFGCTWCVFQPVVNVLVWLLTGFYFVFRDWGLSIIGLVVLVRLLLHPITKRSQRSMMRMAKLGPEMEKLKKKYGDDKDAMAKAMQEFYREHGLAALPLGCLPMLLQTPIWIALYSMLQAEFRLRHAPFLYGWTWIDDLARPDHLVEFGHTYTFFFLYISGLNLLPLLLAIVFYFQMKLQPQPAAMTPEQQTQQTIMKWMMVLMFPLFLYGAPAGLNLYILTSTLIGIWESKRIRAQLKAEDEAKAIEQPTLVKDKAPRNARRRDGSRRDDESAKPALTGWRAKLAQFQENLQKQVEQAQKNSTTRRAKK